MGISSAMRRWRHSPHWHYRILESFAADGIVDLHGTTSDARAQIASADCIILPSYREGFPRAIIEASAMAKAVIASDVPGCRQAVDDRITGYLCRPRSAPSLARAMEEMMRMTAEQRQAMGLRGRERVRPLFLAEKVAAAYLEDVERIGLGNRTPTAARSSSV